MEKHLYRVSGMTKKGGFVFWANDIMAEGRLQAIIIGEASWRDRKRKTGDYRNLFGVNAYRHEEGDPVYRGWHVCEWRETANKYF